MRWFSATSLGNRLLREIAVLRVPHLKFDIQHLAKNSHMPKRSIQHCRALVTGASSGIGQAIARQLARHQARLVLLARRKERLERLAAELRQLGTPAEVVAGDVTDPAVRRQAVQTAAERFDGLDVLVNNAGIGALGLFAEVDDRQMRRVMEVNFFAAVEMTREALPLLRRSDRPMVVNIGSVLGHRAAPHYTAYCASKFALRGWSQSLRVELASEGIDVRNRVFGQPAGKDHRTGLARASACPGRACGPTNDPGHGETTAGGHPVFLGQVLCVARPALPGAGGVDDAPHQVSLHREQPQRFHHVLRP